MASPVALQVDPPTKTVVPAQAGASSGFCSVLSYEDPGLCRDDVWHEEGIGL